MEGPGHPCVCSYHSEEQCPLESKVVPATLGTECCLPQDGSASVIGERKTLAPNHNSVAHDPSCAHHGHLSGDVTCWRAEVPSAVAKRHTAPLTLDILLPGAPISPW